jgi:hypothetical protein
MKLREITSLGVVDADELRAKSVKGNAEATARYAMYAVWRKIVAKAKELNRQTGRETYAKKHCVETLKAMGESVGVSWQI